MSLNDAQIAMPHSKHADRLETPATRGGDTCPARAVAGGGHRGVLGPPKSSYSRRDVPLAPELVGELRRFHDNTEWPGDEDLVFTDTTGGYLHVVNLRRRVLKPAREEANLGWVGFHTFRHTCASRLFAQGRNAVQVQRCSGTTRRRSRRAATSTSWTGISARRCLRVLTGCKQTPHRRTPFGPIHRPWVWRHRAKVRPPHRPATLPDGVVVQAVGGSSPFAHLSGKPCKWAVSSDYEDGSRRAAGNKRGTKLVGARWRQARTGAPYLTQLLLRGSATDDPAAYFVAGGRRSDSGWLHHLGEGRTPRFPSRGPGRSYSRAGNS